MPTKAFGPMLWERRRTTTPERALRGIAIRRENFLHLGSDSGGINAAVIYTLIGSAKLAGIDPQAYLRQLLERVADHPSNRVDELLPWAVACELVRAAPKTPTPADKLAACVKGNRILPSVVIQISPPDWELSSLCDRINPALSFSLRR